MKRMATIDSDRPGPVGHLVQESARIATNTIPAELKMQAILALDASSGPDGSYTRSLIIDESGTT
jgi:hypothetical protein